MPTALITGANRGLGLAFAQRYASEGNDIVATVRPGADTTDLLEAAPGSRIEELDVSDDTSLARFVERIGALPLDLVILNAGVGAGTLARAEQISRAAWETTVATNTFATFFLAAALVDNLRTGSQKKLVGISSLAASMGAYDVPGQYAYRASKAALNSLWRTLSIDWRPFSIVCLLLRPGRVRTRMTDFLGDLDPHDAVRGMSAVIDGAGLEQSGQFIGYDGHTVPW